MSAPGLVIALGVLSGGVPSRPTTLTALEIGGRASDPVVLVAGDVSLRIAIEDASGSTWLSRGEDKIGWSVAGELLVLKASRDRLEDYRWIARRRPGPLARYRLELDPRTALRSVAGVTELVDERGTPRLRMARPFVIDATGRRFDVRTTIEGCAFDSDPRPPWGRAPTPPGSRVCDVVIELQPGTWPAYPLLLDPLWVGTAAMVEPRVTQAVSLGPGGRVLLPGGQNDWGFLASAEMYDEATNSFAVVESLPEARAAFGLAFVEGADVALLAGGCTGIEPACVPTKSSLAFDPATGSWHAVGELAVPRAGQRAYRIAGGGVIVVGGLEGTRVGTEALAATEVYDPAGEVFSAGPPLRSGRYFFGGTEREDGSVMIAGGRRYVGGDDLATVELYDPGGSSWVTLPGLPSERRDPVVAELPDGRVLVAGGSYQVTPLVSSFVLDPKDGWTSTGALASAREGPAAAVLDNGWLVVAGGVDASSAEAIRVGASPALASWTALEPPSEARMRPAQAKLPSGSWLVAGGWAGYGNDALDTAAVLTVAGPGTPCEVGAACASGHCVDGVCCDVACDGPCVACSIAAGAAIDGMCTPFATGTIDPSGACNVEEGCGATGACGNEGTCAVAPFGASCSCYDAAGSCDGAGTCTCSGSTCLDDDTEVDASGAAVDCAPYRCSGGACIESCASSEDCVPGTVCDRSRRCVVTAEVPVAITACACRESPTVPRQSRPEALAALALALLARRFTRTSGRA